MGLDELADGSLVGVELARTDGTVAGPEVGLCGPVADGALIEGEGMRDLGDVESVVLVKMVDAAEGVVVDHRCCPVIKRNR